jgi:sec-independent protein translocase protein TatB
MGFFEILLIAVVTLLVVGPERMPDAVRSAALTIGRIKRAFNQAREEVEKQVGADEIRMQLHNEEVLENLEKFTQDVTTIDPEKGIASGDDTPDARIKPESLP